MLFHIRKPNNVGSVRCGLDIDEIYETLTDHISTEASAENRTLWYEGDAMCVACIRKTRPKAATSFVACRTVPALSWVVRCGCGGVRPYGTACGKDQPLPLDQPRPEFPRAPDSTKYGRPAR